MKKLILAIETSCDETALALVEAAGGLFRPRFKVLKNLVASQIKIHRLFGGVVPNLAKREHVKNLPILLKKMFKPHLSRDREISELNLINLIAVTIGPGLEPALWAGINFAQELAKKYKKPLLGANHLEGHLYSFFLSKTFLTNPSWLNPKNIFPTIALIASGGHTILLKMDSLVKWRKLGETRDDAAGEAFDKVARLLNLPYPGGPEIEKLAKKGNPAAISFPRPMLYQKNYEFSFSGLKTAVFYYLRDLGIGRTGADSKPIKNSLIPLNQTLLADIAASFQKAVVEVLVLKTLRAAKEFKAKSIMLSGGVATNKLLRRTFKKESAKLGYNFFAPQAEYNTDNAVMIAIAGYMRNLQKSAGGGAPSEGDGSRPRAYGEKKYKLEARGDLDI